jgi:CHAD domain-containing protein
MSENDAIPVEPEEAPVVEPEAPMIDPVQAQALTLYDFTRPLHDLDPECRTLMELAARLRRAPVRVSKKRKPRQAALETVQLYADGSQLTGEMLNTLAAVLAYHQGKIKRKDLERFDLSPVQQRQAMTIAAILRIAEGLNQSGKGQTVIQKVELAQDAMWLVVEGPETAADAAAAQNNAVLWARIGYPPVEVMEPAEAAIRMMPFPEPSELIGLSVEDSLTEAGRKVMRFHFAQMLRYEDGTRLGEDIEDLHKMRVSTRRLRAAFEVFSDAFEPGTLKPHLKGLRAAGQALGSVRDLDVLIEKVQHYQAELPEEQRSSLEPLLEAWQQKRQAARAVMLAYLNGPDYAVFKRNFNIFVNTLGAGARLLPVGQPIPARVCELAPVLIYTRLAAVRAFEPYLQSAPVETLHALRIEFKKLRYTLEYFEEVLGEKARNLIESVKKLQDHLGDLNDAQVESLLLRDFIVDWENRQTELPVSERRPIEGVMSYMAARHTELHRLMSGFDEAWEQNFAQASFRRGLAQAVSAL